MEHPDGSKRGSTWWVAVVLTLAWWAAPARGQQATLSVRVVDENEDLLPCRAWVEVAEQRYFQPQQPPSVTPYARDRSFSCDGEFTIEVPAGVGSVHVERGKEFLPVQRPVMTAADQTTTMSIVLKRWVNMPAEGWFSSDMHVHFGANQPRVLKQLALADDVHITPAFTYWLRGNEAEWREAWPAAGAGDEYEIDARHIATYRNIEIERIRRSAPPGGSVGASFLFNLVRPVTTDRFGEHFPSDTTLCLQARRHSPDVVIDTDKPSWAETVVGAALGAYDTVQVCHNHYHRSQTIPGGYGMIGPLDEHESNDADDDGLFHRTNRLYYRFLNCGFRLAVSGGSAIGVMPVPMGYNRVYAHVEGPLTVQKFWTAVKSGRSFASSGPMLTMTVNDLPLGSTIERSDSAESALTVAVHLRSIDRIEALQLVQDGQVVRQDDAVPDPQPIVDRTVTWQVSPVRSGWLAARALLRAPDGRLRQAHTSPVYVRLDGRPIASKQDAQYMIRWIDRLDEVAELPGRFPAEEDRNQVLAVYQRARQVYQNVAQDAARIWGD